MSAITAKASRKMKKYAVLTREPRCFLGSFDFSWEQRKLGELVDRVVRKNTNNESTLPLTISAQYGLVDQITYFNNRVASRDVSNYYLVLNGEFAYNKSTSDGYPFGAVKRLDLYEKGVLSTLYIVFAPKKEQQIDSDYLTVFFDTDRWHKGVAERAAEGARNHGLLNISAEDFFDIDLSVPKDIVEQKQIGAFIRQLDNLITLHQRKCANLCSPSQVVFSLLFVTSTFSWEQRKLGDIASDMVAGGDIDKDLILAEGQYPVIANALTGDGIVGYYDKEYRVNAPAVTVTGRGDVGHAKARLVNFTPVVRLLSVKSEHDVFFLESAINTLKIVIESTGVPQLTVPQLAKYEVAFPRQLDEEEHIGAFFKQLDHLITLHQRECISFTGRADRLILTANKKRTTSSWEQRKLGDIASDMVAGGDIDKDLILAEGQYPVIANALTGDGIVGYYDKEYRVNAPAVTVTGRGDVGHAKARLVNFTPVVRLLSVKSEHDVFFLESAINTLKIVIESTGVPQLTVPQLAKYEVAFPRQLDEEEHIGAFFKQLDHLITLHQRKPFLMKWRTSDANRNQTNRLVL